MSDFLLQNRIKEGNGQLSRLLIESKCGDVPRGWLLHPVYIHMAARKLRQLSAHSYVHTYVDMLHIGHILCECLSSRPAEFFPTHAALHFLFLSLGGGCHYFRRDVTQAKVQSHPPEHCNDPFYSPTRDDDDDDDNRMRGSLITHIQPALLHHALILGVIKFLVLFLASVVFLLLSHEQEVRTQVFPCSR